MPASIDTAWKASAGSCFVSVDQLAPSLATATTIVMAQTTPTMSNALPMIFSNADISVSPHLADGIHEHPEGSHGKTAMDQVADNRACAPGCLYAAEHGRHD